MSALMREPSHDGRFGEFGGHMLDSARVIPEAPLRAGYRYRYPELSAALRDVVKRA